MPGVWTLREAQEGHAAQQWPPFYDPFLSSVSLSLNFEGTFFDQSAKAFGINPINGASISATTSAVGTRSALFSAASSQYLTLVEGDENAITFNTGDYCLEAWVYVNSYSQASQATAEFSKDMFLFSNADGGLYIENTNSGNYGRLRWYTNQTSGFGVVSTGAINQITQGRWFHVAAARQSSTFRLFVNGVVRATQTDSRDYTNPYTAIGGRSFLGNQGYFDGYLDGVRITKGQARYTSDFTPFSTLPTK
jgi:hypothetical protein